MAYEHGTSPACPVHNSDSDVFRPIEVPSRPMENQNVNVNAKLKH